MYLKQFFVHGLGHASYLIASDLTKEAAVIDPRRDIDVYMHETQRAGLTIRYALETHNHNDFISGAHQLATRFGVDHVASAAAELNFPYHAVRDGDEIQLGELRIMVQFTPGHTPEHVTYVVTDTMRAADPVLVFTGGDLLVGSVGRPDLLGRELGEKLAPLLYDSLHNKILKLEDYVEVLPTHGAGSLCGRAISSKRTSTIGYERRFNPALQQKDKQAFVDFVLNGNPGIPAYYRHMRPTNQHGPAEWHLPESKAFSPGEIEHLIAHGATVLDLRPAAAFGGGHIPGSINIPWEASSVTWAGWLLPFDTPLVLVLERAEQWAEVVTTLARIGFEHMLGYLQSGIDSWIEAGLPVRRIEQWSIHDLKARLDDPQLQIIDVRMESEWQAGHIVGATHLMLGDLPQQLAAIDRTRTIALICGSGFRSGIAASTLQQHGLDTVVNVLGGMTAWEAADYPVISESQSGTEQSELYDDETGKEQQYGDQSTDEVRVRNEDQLAVS